MDPGAGIRYRFAAAREARRPRVAMKVDLR
jgi:hypothetical protein